MKIVVDTSEIISAVIRDSKAREIIINSGFIMPLIVFEEVKKYEALIIEKSRLSREEVWKMIKILCKYIKLIQDEELKPFIYDALRIIDETDEEDALFIASALAYPDGVIWSNDKHFKKQNKVKVYTTKELLEL